MLSVDRLRKLGRASLIAADLVVVLLLVAVATLIWKERGWAKPQIRGAQDAFLHGTIGTEVMPLAVAEVLPDLFPDNFQPAGKDKGDWVAQFGFMRDPDPKAGQGLPIGFVVSNYRPQSGAPSPIAFVGFSCALCHSTRVRESDTDAGRIIYGPGSNSLNLFAWLDAFQASILARETAGQNADAAKPRPYRPTCSAIDVLFARLDAFQASILAREPAGQDADAAKPRPYRLTCSAIDEAYEKKHERRLGLAELAMTALWLRQIRSQLTSGLPRFDEPYGEGRSRDPQYTPTGPTRTEPFRTLIRRVINRPGNDMPVYTKIATVFSEDMRHRAQFDGTIADLYARSSMAALAAGATVANMRVPEIVNNIQRASDFTATLRPPRYDDLFPRQAASRDAAKVSRGREVYTRECASCHGDRDASGAWKAGPYTGEITPLSKIRTDGERVMFRHYGELGGRLFALLPEDHPFHFPREAIWPHQGEEDNLAIRGYINQPLGGMFLRAPYLHNGSVLTLAELINLKKRRDVFYRGGNIYDLADVGFRSPEQATDRDYFKFDASIRGNSNQGHDYPWAWNDAGRNTDDLEALLEYLKTL
jgi:cytochrome c5